MFTFLPFLAYYATPAPVRINRLQFAMYHFIFKQVKRLGSVVVLGKLYSLLQIRSSY